jgi:MYXO-CTERM domain-containing protein
LGIDTVVSNFGWHKELSQLMKSNFITAVSAGVLSLSIGVLPLTLSAQAQTTNDPGANTTSGTSTSGTTTTATSDDRNDFDWGWLGLLGLAGLAGLAGKKSENQPTAYRDPNAPGATTYRD